MAELEKGQSGRDKATEENWMLLSDPKEQREKLGPETRTRANGMSQLESKGRQASQQDTWQGLTIFLLFRSIIS